MLNTLLVNLNFINKSHCVFILFLTGLEFDLHGTVALGVLLEQVLFLPVESQGCFSSDGQWFSVWHQLLRVSV